jgi:hypothetical protein
MATSMRRLRALRKTTTLGKWRRLVWDRVIALQGEYDKPYPEEVIEELNELVAMYKTGENQTPKKSTRKRSNRKSVYTVRRNSARQ